MCVCVCINNIQHASFLFSFKADVLQSLNYFFFCGFFIEVNSSSSCFQGFLAFVKSLSLYIYKKIQCKYYILYIKIYEIHHTEISCLNNQNLEHLFYGTSFLINEISTKFKFSMKVVLYN